MTVNVISRQVYISNTVTASVFEEKVSPLTRRLAAAAYRKGLIDGIIARDEARKKRYSTLRSRVPRLLVVGILMISMYVTYDTWQTNQALKAQLQGASGVVAAVNTTDTATAQDRQQAEGRDEQQPATDLISKYAVAPDAPRILTIAKINVKARILPMSVNADGSMQAPINIYDAGWYTGGVRPGDKGAAVIDAHASGPTRMGLFGRLDTLSNGDKITIEKGDGTILNYEVVETKKVPRDNLDMRELLTPKVGEEGLNLITCTGTWQQQGETYSDRALVFTKRI
jgi:LPXTG-site transpeptidase (sortase) family protein